MQNVRSAILAATLVASALPATAYADLELNRMTIGTNPNGSTFYLIGSGISRLYQTELGVRTTAQPNVGSSVYLPMVSNGDLTLGVSGSVDAGMAYHGEGSFPVEMENLRVLAKIWELPYAYITRGDSAIEKVEDLRGKTVMGNMPTNVALTAINKAMLKAGGLEIDEVDFSDSGGLMSGIDAVIQGRADAAPVATTMPVLMESHGTVPGGLRVVANGAEASPEFYGELLPGITTTTVQESSRYPFVVGNTEVTTYDVYLVASDSLGRDDAYILTKTLYENWPQLQEDYPPLRPVDQSSLYMSNSTISYHEGALDYYREID